MKEKKREYMQSSFMPIQKFYSLKSVFEELWGKGTYLELKHCSDISTWKKYSERTLKASLVAIEETVKIKDEHWHKAVQSLVAHGIERIKISHSFDDLFESLSATYVELSFLQIGLMPDRPSDIKATLRKQDWGLDRYRTVQYVQSPDQKKALGRRMQRIQEYKNKAGSEQETPKSEG